MNAGWKGWLTGLANAAISGATVGITGTVLNIGFKKAAIMIGVSALVSVGKWVVQHPLPGTPTDSR